MDVAAHPAIKEEALKTNPGVTDSVQVLTESGLAVVGPVTETTGTFSFDETAAGEQTAFTVTIATRSVVGGIWLDMVNATQNTTIRVYHQIDGTLYRVFESNNWLVAGDDGVLFDPFTAYRNIRVTLQCGGGGVGAVNVPYVVV